MDDHRYFGAFYGMDDEKRKMYPKISVAVMLTKSHTLNDVLFTLAHEMTHYYQWYFQDEDKRTDRSLEMEANKWARYIVQLYFNDKGG